MKEIEIDAKTVEEAVRKAIKKLKVSEDEVEVEVMKKGRSGVLGVGSEEARVKVKVIDKSKDDKKNDDDVLKVAEEVLAELVKLLGLEAKITVIPSTEDGLPVTLNIEGDDLGVLIGRRGQALASLQYVLKLIISERMKTWVPLNVDVAGYKKRRYESLRSLALRLADQVVASKRSINVEPMPADERRIIHITLADHQDVVTQSIGDGNKRKVVVSLRKR